jgi:uncharacterized protein YdeI (YjbR/CyaY-like superfamily)
MAKPEQEVYYPKSKGQWRKWLEKNHKKKDSVWIVFYKQNAGKPGLTWSEAVDEALCFGWIDSLKKKLDDERSVQFFSKRKPSSTWSKINKEKIKKLTAEGLMREAGLESIKTAKKNGSWTILDDVEKLIIPDDLQKALKTNKGAGEFFLTLSKSNKKMLLQWVKMAKTEGTRERRIKEIAEHAMKQQKPPSFR